MATRELLHELVDALPEAVLPAVARYLEAARADALPDVPEDDEPVTAADRAAIAESRAAYERGEYVTSPELRARLGLPSSAP